MDLMRKLECMSGITGIPLTMVDQDGNILRSWPEIKRGTVSAPSVQRILDYFRTVGSSTSHPLICIVEPGFLLGVAQLATGSFLLVGLVSPYRHTRDIILAMANETIQPAHLQEYCDMLLKQPPVSLEKLKELLCILTQLAGEEVEPEDVLFPDDMDGVLGASAPDRSLFEQLDTDAHVPLDFEAAICSAIELGDGNLLKKAVFSPVQGTVGRMSSNDLRQQKYSFICLTTLASRAAIRGGLATETALNLSDLYCQRADLLGGATQIQNLTYKMLVDFCDKVNTSRRDPAISDLIGICMDYISVHLHEPISLDALSTHCGLCGRSLSMRFRKEVGMAIPDYIHGEKVKEARYLLRHTSYSLSEIASFLNYPSQSYFTHIFRKHTQQTPQQYRESAS